MRKIFQYTRKHLIIIASLAAAFYAMYWYFEIITEPGYAVVSALLLVVTAIAGNSKKDHPVDMGNLAVFFYWFTFFFIFVGIGFFSYKAKNVSHTTEKECRNSGLITVISENGTPIGQAKIDFLKDGQALFTGKTNKSGVYKYCKDDLHKIPKDELRVKISKPGYGEKIAEIYKDWDNNNIILDKDIYVKDPRKIIRDKQRAILEYKIGKNIDNMETFLINDTLFFFSVSIEGNEALIYTLYSGYSLSEGNSWIITREREINMAYEENSIYKLPERREEMSHTYLKLDIGYLNNSKYVFLENHILGNIGGSVIVNVFALDNLEYVLQCEISGRWSGVDGKFDIATVEVKSLNPIKGNNPPLSNYVKAKLDEKYITYDYASKEEEYVKLLSRKWSIMNPGFSEVDSGSINFQINREEFLEKTKGLKVSNLRKTEKMDVFIVDYCLYAANKDSTNLYLLMCNRNFGEYGAPDDYDADIFLDTVGVRYIEYYDGFSKVITKKFFSADGMKFETRSFGSEEIGFINLQDETRMLDSIYSNGWYQ